uniref:Uncharacterized protein n=1 Tax=Romanomermis culicivorax TaxID=13658 RepID=A0A915J3K2_ROMCU
MAAMKNRANLLSFTLDSKMCCSLSIYLLIVSLIKLILSIAVVICALNPLDLKPALYGSYFSIFPDRESSYSDAILASKENHIFYAENIFCSHPTPYIVFSSPLNFSSAEILDELNLTFALPTFRNLTVALKNVALCKLGASVSSTNDVSRRDLEAQCHCLSLNWLLAPVFAAIFTSLISFIDFVNILQDFRFNYSYPSQIYCISAVSAIFCALWFFATLLAVLNVSQNFISGRSPIFESRYNPNLEVKSLIVAESRRQRSYDFSFLNWALMDGIFISRQIWGPHLAF